MVDVSIVCIYIYIVDGSVTRCYNHGVPTCEEEEDNSQNMFNMFCDKGSIWVVIKVA